MVRDYVAEIRPLIVSERPSRTIRTIIRSATYIEETVEDGVAEGGIADDIVPVLDRDLAGEQGATAGIAVVEDLEEVMSSLP